MRASSSFLLLRSINDDDSDNNDGEAFQSPIQTVVGVYQI